jgi:hypothetical protein
MSKYLHYQSLVEGNSAKRKARTINKNQFLVCQYKTCKKVLFDKIIFSSQLRSQTSFTSINIKAKNAVYLKRLL